MAELEDHELGWPRGRYRDLHDDQAQLDLGLVHRLAEPDTDPVCLLGGVAGERAAGSPDDGKDRQGPHLVEAGDGRNDQTQLGADQAEADMRIARARAEERRARAIVRAMIRQREHQPLRTTGELSRLVLSVLGRPPAQKIHPATRTFQALRIAVNDELGQLDVHVLETLGAHVDPDGRDIDVVVLLELEALAQATKENKIFNELNLAALEKNEKPTYPTKTFADRMTLEMDSILDPLAFMGGDVRFLSQFDEVGP